MQWNLAFNEEKEISFFDTIVLLFEVVIKIKKKRRDTHTIQQQQKKKKYKKITIRLCVSNGSFFLCIEC